MCTLPITANSFSLNSLSTIHCLVFRDNVLNQAVATIATGNSILQLSAETACLQCAYRFIDDWTIACSGRESLERRSAISWLLLLPEIGVNRHGQKGHLLVPFASPGTPPNIFARCSAHRRCLDAGAHRVAACLRTPVPSSPVLPRYRRSQLPADYQWDARREVRTAVVQG